MTTIPTSAKQLFDDLIPRGLQLHPEKAKQVNAIYAFRIKGEGGGDWVVDLTGAPPTCAPGQTERAQCTIEIDHSDFQQMLSDPNAGMQLYFSGKLRVTGDPMLATRLQQFFKLAA
jgi:alkyl sulfatase BDS1-like metallo-beta-lactamase superfamily hydrolase